MEELNYFQKLNNINVNEHTEKKNELTYLSWAWAWAKVKTLFPDSTYTIYENTLPNGYVVNYFTDGKTAWVKTGVTINGIEHIEELPVMDYRNKSIFLDNLTSFDVNKAIQRSLTKACARHGLGLYIYAGEDLPENETVTPANVQMAQEVKQSTKEELLAELETLGFDIDKYADYCHKTVEDLTNEDLAKAVALKRKEKNTVNSKSFKGE